MLWSWQGSRAAPGESGLHARGEGERVLALESREGTRASRRVEEGLSSVHGIFQARVLEWGAIAFS